MKFLVDAQLPPRLAASLAVVGHDAIHVASLPNGERSSDADVARIADRDERVVVTKDADFRHSHSVAGTPARLLLVATGNIRNDVLVDLVDDRIDEIVTAYSASCFIELHHDVVIVHGDV